MSEQTEAHLEDEVFTALVRGKLDDPAWATALPHLKACAACLKKLEDLGQAEDRRFQRWTRKMVRSIR